MTEPRAIVQQARVVRALIDNVRGVLHRTQPGSHELLLIELALDEVDRFRDLVEAPRRGRPRKDAGPAARRAQLGGDRQSPRARAKQAQLRRELRDFAARHPRATRVEIAKACGVSRATAISYLRTERRDPAGNRRRVREYSRAHPDASLRTIATALGMGKSTVFRYLQETRAGAR